jgi:tight adherence protein B
MTIVLLSVAIAFLLSAQAIYYAVLYRAERKQSELRRRLRTLAGQEKGPGGGLLRGGRLAKNPGAARLVGQLPFARDLEQLLFQTDLDWTVAGMLGTGAAVGFGSALALTIFLPGASLLLFLLVPIGLFTPVLLALMARTRRNAKISEQLPDALDMMVRSLRAGHGTSAGFRLVATEMPIPIAVEFGRCFEEQQAGASMRDSVRNMTERVPDNLDLRIFATSLIIQHETGGNLVEILEKIAETVRERYKFYGKLRALTSEARMSGYVLGALPFVSALAVAMTNPSYIRPLLTDPMGNVIALGGIVFWILGVFWMRKLSQVEY